MLRSLWFRNWNTSHPARIALKIATAGALGILVACSAQEDTPRAGAVQSSAPDRASTATHTPTTPVTTVEAKPTEVTATPARTEKKIVAEVRRIPFSRVTVKDSSLAKGKTVVTTRGVSGRKRLTYEVTLTNGVQISKRVVREVIITPPIVQVTAIGTRVERKPVAQCDPNYSGACVPIASDVDCAGGSGNGPAYVSGPVRVVGTDIYDLDRNGDGIGCED
jgi:resuscitation-promoting factor RpfB